MKSIALMGQIYRNAPAVIAIDSSSETISTTDEPIKSYAIHFFLSD